MVKFKDFSRPLSVFQVLFKANLIFKTFLYIQVVFKTVLTLSKALNVCCGSSMLFRVLVEFNHDKNLICCSFYNKIFHNIMLSFISVYTGCIMGGCR